MLTELLWIVAAKRQHDIQKASGIAGITGFIIILLVAYNWSEVYKLLDWIGLVSIAENLDMIVPGSGVNTFINVFFGSTIILFAISFATALPTFLMILGLQVFDNNNKSATKKAAQFAISVAIWPFFLILAFYYRVIRERIIPTREKTAIQYAHANEKLKQFVSPKNAWDNEVIFPAFIEQYNASPYLQGSQITTRAYTKEEAVTFLNCAVPDFKNNKNYLFGYDTLEGKWVFMMPNPIPVFASYCGGVYKEEVSPYNYLKQVSDFHYNGQGIVNDGQKLSFHLPVRFITTNWDKYSSTAEVKVSEQVQTAFISIDRITHYMEVRGEFIDKLYADSAKGGYMLRNHNKVHARAFTIPLAYPQEVEYYNNANAISYYRELEKVPNVKEFCNIYKNEIQHELQDRARNGHEWAKNILNKQQVHQ